MRAVAYLNQGRWVADCPTPYCAGAERVWPGAELRHLRDGTPYGITAGAKMHCAECGTVSDVVFPEDRDKIDKLMKSRPVPATRNWLPGETLDQLATENEAL